MPGSDPFLNSFAKQRLRELGHKIFIAGNQVLVPNKFEYHIWDADEIRTHILSNVELVEEGNIKEIKNVKDLAYMGFMVVSEKAKKRYFSGQSVIYKLRRYNAHIPHLDNMPNNHKIEYDELNERIRIKGRNAGPLGIGDWNYINPKGVDKKDRYLNVIDDTQKIKRMLLSKYMPIEEEPEIIKIPEIPIMISNRGEVVCIEDARDEPVIGIVGGRGCFLGSEKIWINTPDGKKLESLESLYENYDLYPHALSLNERKLKVESMPINKIIKREPQDIFTIKVRGHEKIEVTPKHKMLVMDEDGKLKRKEARKIKKGDVLPRLKSIGKETLKKRIGLGHPLIKYVNSDVSWVPVHSVQKRKNEKPVYDIQVVNNNNVLLKNQVFVAQSGKTMFAHSIIDRVYWKRDNTRIAVMNDSLYQTMPWTLPCDRHMKNRNKLTNMFVKGIQKIGEHPMPLPLVFIHPNTENLREMVFPRQKISFRATIPFKHVIQNYNYFLKGKKEWILGKTAPYFRNIKEQLLKCTNLDDVEEVLKKAVDEDKLNKQSKHKIYSVLIDMFNQRFLDVNTGIPAYWEVKRRGENLRKMNPVLAAMEADLIPVMMTQNLQPKDYFPQYMRYYLDSIFEYHITEGKRKGLATWIFIDEMPDISSTTNKTVAAYSLRRCVTEGRNPKLGTMFALQNWSKVDPQIRNNTTHLFSYHNKAKEAREIANDFDLPKHIEEDIINLEKFRLVAMTHEKFIVYTPDGERYETSDPIKGKAIMPLSQHQAPGGSDMIGIKEDRLGGDE